MTLDIDIPFFELHINISNRSARRLAALAAATASAAVLIAVNNKTHVVTEIINDTVSN